MTSSRIPGFYKLEVHQRRQLLQEHCELGPHEWQVLDSGGLDQKTCDQMIENVIGQYRLPFAVGLNFQINQRDFLVPMVIEEPSVVAAASNAARMIREGGGFSAEVSEPIMIGQVQLLEVENPALAKQELLKNKATILSLAAKQVPGLVKRGGGPVDMEVRILSQPSDPDGGMLVVHLHVHVCDAMGANMVNTVAEGVAELIATIANAKIGLRILSNLATHRTVTVRAFIPTSVLDKENGTAVCKAIVSASRFAELDPYRATTHNKGIMNGIDAVIMATANDWRSVEAGAHAYAAQSGTYRPLAIWSHAEYQGKPALQGEMTLPLAVGTVGGALQVHGAAKLALKLLRSHTASDLAAVSASAGLACNLAALKALATEGIQKGHMALHARIVARKQKLKDTQAKETP